MNQGNLNSLSVGKRIVIKVGSTLLVDRERGVVHRRWLETLAEDIAQLRQHGQDVLVVSSGAIALGRRQLGFASGSLKLEEKQSMSINKDKLVEIRNAITKNASGKELMEVFESIYRYPTQILFNKYIKYVDGLCTHLHKSVRIEFNPNNCELTYDEMSKLDLCIGHILRNCVDHGIEKPIVRSKIHKS